MAETFPSLLDRLENTPEREVLRFDGRSLPAGEACRRIHEIAAGLAAQGIGHGDRVAIWLPNRPEWVLIHMAALSIGALSVPIQTRYGAAETATILRQSGASLVFLQGSFRGIDFAALLAEAQDRLQAAGAPTPRAVVLDRGPAGSDAWGAFLAAGRGGEPAAAALRAQVQPDDPALCIFTSGTTGTPKGVLLSHRAILATESRVGDVLQLGPEDRVLYAPPLASVFGCCNALTASWTHGAALVLLETFDAAQSLATIARDRCTALYGVPTMFLMQLEHPDLEATDRSSLRTGIVGGAPASRQLVTAIRERLGVHGLVSGYGLSETCAVVTLTRIGDPPEVVSDTVGRPLPDVEVRIFEPEEKRVLAAGEDGEIQVRGCNVMLGYLDQPEATAKALTDDGWLRTGDIGRLDEAGNLKITGRSSDMYLVGGFNVYPVEVENLLATHPAVAEACVVGVPDRRLGEVGLAFVRLGADTEASEQELIAYCSGRIARHKVPRKVIFLEALPMTPLGKLHRQRLREMGAAQTNASEANSPGTNPDPGGKT